MDKEKWISDYFAHRLNESDKALFKERLYSDEQFRAEYEEYKDMHHAFHIVEREDLKTLLNTLEEEHHLTPSNAKSSFRRWLIPVAACMGLFVIYLFGIQNSSKRIYEDYFDIYPNLYAPVLRSENSVDIQTKAFQLYEAGYYEEAEQQFSQIVDDPDGAFLFYRFMALLNSGQYEKAGQLRDTLDTLPTSYEDEILWYGALLNIRLNKRDSALEDLRDLADKNSRLYPSKRKELEKRLTK